MRTIVLSTLATLLAGVAVAETPDPPIENTRLRVSTLVREDIFAGWMDNDMERFARAENNLERLLELRPKSKPEILSWLGAAKLYRAVLAHEAGNAKEFEQYYQESRDLFGQARESGRNQLVVDILIGGSYLEFGDRLPKEYIAVAWSEAYDCYRTMWKRQSRVVERMPLHIRGELLSGLAESAERTGHDDECNEFLDKIVELLPDSQYEAAAVEWKTDPTARANTRISCKYCHDEGKLESTVARLKD